MKVQELHVQIGDLLEEHVQGEAADAGEAGGIGGKDGTGRAGEVVAGAYTGSW